MYRSLLSISKISAKLLCLNNLEPEDNFFSKQPSIKGVYLWGYKNDVEQVIPLYVGKSRNIYERILQHYCRFSGGEYRIPLKLFKTEHSIENIFLDTKNSYEPNALSTVYGLFNTENVYRENLKYILLNFRFQFLELNDKDNRIKAEKYLGQQIGVERLISSIPSMDFSIEFVPLRDKIDKEFGKYFKNS